MLLLFAAAKLFSLGPPFIRNRWAEALTFVCAASSFSFLTSWVIINFFLFFFFFFFFLKRCLHVRSYVVKWGLLFVPFLRTRLDPIRSTPPDQLDCIHLSISVFLLSFPIFSIFLLGRWPLTSAQINNEINESECTRRRSVEDRGAVECYFIA